MVAGAATVLHHCCSQRGKTLHIHIYGAILNIHVKGCILFAHSRRIDYKIHPSKCRKHLLELAFHRSYLLATFLNGRGCNIRLAGMLVGKEIEVWRELPKDEIDDEEEDVLLVEFNDVIEDWIIEKLQNIGCDTAKSVLALSAADIAKRADLEDETVEEILDILRAEFEDEE